MHIHKAEEELTHVLDGEMECVLEEPFERAPVGSFFLMPKGTRYTFSDPGPDAARILVVLTPGLEEPILGGSVAATGGLRGDSDPERMRELQEKHNMDARGRARRFSRENRALVYPTS